MRGRLIIPFLLEIKRLDTDATAADPDAAGPLTTGYDPDFKEPIRLDNGASARKEKASVLVPVQPENNAYEQLQQLNAGNDPTSRMVFTMHFQDLEEMGLVDSVSGEALIRVNDRAVAIYKMDGTFIQTLGTDQQGFFLTEAMPASFGLSGGERNLLICTFERRDRAYRGA